VNKVRKLKVKIRKQRKNENIDAVDGVKNERNSSPFALRKRKEKEYRESVAYKLKTIAAEQRAYKKWYKLDNAALLYPMNLNSESNSVFRISVLLKEKVDPVTLQYAVNDLYPRFPTITGCVKYGFFWPYIDKPLFPIVVTEENVLPCRPQTLNNAVSQLRVLYFDHTIACEFFHSATDGTGGVRFVNCLVKTYLMRLGHTINDETNAVDARDIPTSEEFTDQCKAIAVRKNPPKLPTPVKARKIGGTPLPEGSVVAKRGYCDATQLKNVAKAHDVSITMLLGAVTHFALAKVTKTDRKSMKHPIKSMVPVNLRKIYDLDTMRNFSNYIFYSSEGNETVEELLAKVKQQQADQMNKDYFTGMVSYNYNSGNHPLLKIVPLGVKKLAINAVLLRMGDGVVNTSTLSNLGLIEAPAEFKEHVYRYDFQLGRAGKNSNGVGVATFNNVCSLNVTSAIEETTFERTFFRTLAELGIDVALEADIVEGI
jgi:NRPS condensation-like uncharacterized protein